MMKASLTAIFFLVLAFANFTVLASQHSKAYPKSSRISRDTHHRAQQTIKVQYPGETAQPQVVGDMRYMAKIMGGGRRHARPSAGRVLRRSHVRARR
ncbi:hypothetical protein BJ508DRAFT_413716 [Ascobolus immersus RN42]|uniref:Uncharacterized protein n=1 Tax=Ascobolus immersus RN42 TaxID=1160509 RepID=A0A3N4IAE0_ASCIM|nr:hypothetical protein BJ508DRAFT_413716 [Ascobolus immersus RN42]